MSEWIPSPADLEHLRDVLHDLQGVGHISAFLASGYTRYQVAALMRMGDLKRPRIGWYVSPDIPPEAVRAIRVGGVLGCASAAQSYGLAVPERSGDVLHVSLADNASRLRSSRDRTWQMAAGDEPGVLLHWLPRLDPLRGWRVAPRDAVLQMAGCTTTEWLTAAIDSARRPDRDGQVLLPAAELAGLRTALPARAHVAVDLSDASSESPPESLVRLRLLLGGIRFTTQVWLLPGHRVDFLLEGRVVLEVDGAAHHSGEHVFEADRARDALLRSWGYPVIRLSYRQVMDEWPAMLSMIRRVLAETR